jgi:hypothetical protein
VYDSATSSCGRCRASSQRVTFNTGGIHSGGTGCARGFPTTFCDCPTPSSSSSYFQPRVSKVDLPVTWKHAGKNRRGAQLGSGAKDFFYRKLLLINSVAFEALPNNVSFSMKRLKPHAWLSLRFGGLMSS